MPFLEAIGLLILLGIGLFLFVSQVALLLVIAAAAFMAILCTGWIPILMCASDPAYAIGFQYGFVGSWASISLIVYSISSVGIIFLSMTMPDPDGLPVGWKFLSYFYTYAPAKTAKSSIGTEERSWASEDFLNSMRSGASSFGFHKAASARQMRQEAERARKKTEQLKRDNDKRKEELDAAAEMAEAMADLEREKARREGFKEGET